MLPYLYRIVLRLLSALIVASLAGCASMSALLPSRNTQDATQTPAIAAVSQDPEAQVLARLGSLTAGEQILLSGGVRAVSDAPYEAASGRPCRWVSLSYPDTLATRRLACGLEGGWQWVPSVTADIAN